jgi:hypothetical protein
VVTFDEGAPDLSLETGERLTEGRLRQVKPRGGTPKMQLGCQCLHVVQVAKLHISLLVPTSRQTATTTGYWIGDTVSITAI